ncbi:hypothetical protein B0H13DRAFT_842310 [Mycena leptocephala]|nr:hypothetical protein B0H13DRAFT_842310 [Mycena leptocephala]
MSQLTNVVDLRSSFYGESDGEEAIEMPYLRFASLAVDSSAEELDIGEILNCFDFPGIQGLNLKLMTNHSPDVLSPVPDHSRAQNPAALRGACHLKDGAVGHPHGNRVADGLCRRVARHRRRGCIRAPYADQLRVRFGPAVAGVAGASSDGIRARRGDGRRASRDAPAAVRWGKGSGVCVPGTVSIVFAGATVDAGSRRDAVGHPPTENAR